jgi:exosortase A
MKRDPLPAPVSAAPADLRNVWRAALLALGTTLVAIVAAYWTTAASMVSTWARSETFTHGFVVAPISLWLVWRARRRLPAIEPRPSWIALPLLAGCGVLWLAGAAGEVNAAMQAAFVASLILSVAAVLGLRVARAITFPLGFLFFAVPFGDFLLPALMEHTADFTVAAVRASGVPVFREGLLIVLPTGRWSIVEACSGVRYLIASLMTGTLFAYLSYTANWRRWVFVGVSAVVPIVANWVRAYLIVMLGHLSNNRLATGVDHLVYGWVFFGLVMLLMFWIGSLWKEPRAARATASDAAIPAARPQVVPARFAGVAGAVLLVALVWPLVDYTMQRGMSERPVALKTVDIPGWVSSPADTHEFAPHFVGSSKTLHEVFRRGDATVGLYVAYYRDHDPRRKLVSSDNALVRSNDTAWLKLSETSREARIGSAPTTVLAARVRSAGGESLVIWQWYWIDGALTSSDARAKARLAWSRLTGRGDDGAAVVIYAADRGDQPAQPMLEAFVRDAWPVLETALAAARDAR